MRYAVYLTPRPGSGLLARGEAWLGRSAFYEGQTAPIAPAAARVATPARYGLHATMRAPFHPAEGVGEADIVEAFETLARNTACPSASLNVANLSGFVALLAPTAAETLGTAAMAALHAMEPLRRPINAHERARRGYHDADARGRELIERWGYPLVEERFVFHITLSGRLQEGEAERVLSAAEAHLGPTLSEPQALPFALFREDRPGGPFRVIALQEETGMPRLCEGAK